jgi:hypothetical protein
LSIQYIKDEVKRFAKLLLSNIDDGKAGLKITKTIISELGALIPDIEGAEKEFSDLPVNEISQKFKLANKKKMSKKPAGKSPRMKRLFSENITKLFRLRFGLNPEGKRFTHEEAFLKINPQAESMTAEEKDRKSLYLMQGFSKAMKELEEVLEGKIDFTKIAPDNFQLVQDLKAAFPGKNVDELKLILRGKTSVVLASGAEVTGNQPFRQGSKTGDKDPSPAGSNT